MSDNTCFRAILHNRCALRFLLVLWCALGTKSLGTTALEGLLVHWLETEDLDKCDGAIHLLFYCFYVEIASATVEDDVVAELLSVPFLRRQFSEKTDIITAGGVCVCVCVSTEGPVVIDTVRHWIVDNTSGFLICL